MKGLPLFLLLALLIVAGKVCLKILWPKLKGFIGEQKTGMVLEDLPDNHLILHDLLLQNGGRTSQVDHVVISPQGIFVIETKAYDGWIFGSEGSQYWIQVLGRKRRRFYNPVRQNRAHVQALRNALAGYGYLPCRPVVVFSDVCEFKKMDTTTAVIHRRELVDFILHSTNGDVLTQDDIGEIYEHLLRANVRSKEIRKQHLNYVKAVKERQSVRA